MNLLLVGYGNMGSALLLRWKKSTGLKIDRFFAIDPEIKGEMADCYPSLDAFPAEYAPDIIVFAVKPNQLASILPAYRARFGTQPLYISIAAGKTLAFYRQHLGEQAHIVRAMPNTPAMIGYGMTALCAANLPEESRHKATQLMNDVGKTIWIQDESQMDAVTAISGCGPAYVFLFLDALHAAAQAMRLEGDLRQIVIETVKGSCMLADGSIAPFEQLRQNVASPGGSTEAALKVLMQGNAFETLVKEAVLAAAKRARELAK